MLSVEYKDELLDIALENYTDISEEKLLSQVSLALDSAYRRAIRDCTKVLIHAHDDVESLYMP